MAHQRVPLGNVDLNKLVVSQVPQVPQTYLPAKHVGSGEGATEKAGVIGRKRSADEVPMSGEEDEIERKRRVVEGAEFVNFRREGSASSGSSSSSTSPGKLSMTGSFNESQGTVFTEPEVVAVIPVPVQTTMSSATLTAPGLAVDDAEAKITAEKLRLRLAFAMYKVRTNQTDITLSQLQIQQQNEPQLPPPYRRFALSTPRPSSATIPVSTSNSNALSSRASGSVNATARSQSPALKFAQIDSGASRSLPPLSQTQTQAQSQPTLLPPIDVGFPPISSPPAANPTSQRTNQRARTALPDSPTPSPEKFSGSKKSIVSASPKLRSQIHRPREYNRERTYASTSEYSVPPDHTKYQNSMNNLQSNESRSSGTESVESENGGVWRPQMTVQISDKTGVQTTTDRNERDDEEGEKRSASETARRRSVVESIEGEGIGKGNERGEEGSEKQREGAVEGFLGLRIGGEGRE